MTVRVEKLVNRDVYEVTYDGASGSGAIKAAMVGADGNESDYKGLDDGKFVVTRQTGSEGDAEIEITDEDGNVIDSGSVHFG